ncbi:MAG TPA: DUF1080 domain-containing protein [Cyclobacteriaceae bacterium]|nr:DUF1080 domain-containing protein [Cyclobacteriaceae bacterium]
MRYLLCVIIFSTLFFTGCKKADEKSESSTEPEAAQTPASMNAKQLSEEQKAEGWKLLFDGQSMTGWRTYRGLENNSWEVVDGTLHCKPFDNAEKRADLMTEGQYKNFELAFEWKISSQGNSGVIYRATEEYDEPYFTGPEYQVLDDGGYPGEVKEKNFSGGAYDMYAPVNKTLKPVGEWNSAMLIVNGNHVEHWLNGAKVVEYEIGSDDWKKRKAESKWNDVKDYGVPTEGHIDLQDHKNEVWFRNIMIKEL